MLMALVALMVGAGAVTLHLRRAAGRFAPITQQVRHRITLAVDPADATVQIDHLPVTRDELFFEPGKSHVLFASASGRIARRFSFEAKSDLELLVHLGRTLALPTPVDPGPAPSESAAQGSVIPASRDEITQAFAKLARYARCLTLLGYADGEARKGGLPARPSNSDMSACVQLLDEANPLAPPMFQLHAAGVAYLKGVQSEPGTSTLHKLLASFRAEFLAVRSGWQMEELARQKEDEGQTAAWHLRRLALAAQAWLRQSRATSASVQAAKQSRDNLAEAHQALLDVAKRSPKTMAQVTGAAEFMAAAQEVGALAQGAAGKRAGGALVACRQLLDAFNALVVD